MDFLTTLKQLPKEIVNTENDHSGICVRFRTSLNKWYVGYGKNNKLYGGFGDTPEEAMESFLLKMRS